jgi:glycosyltransferase involved in cell wall biosynthesis
LPLDSRILHGALYAAHWVCRNFINNTNKVDVAIIIPTRNRQESLRRTLASVVQCMDGVSSYEVIVVDNGSSDGTAEVVRSAQQRHPQCEIRYFHEPIPGLLSGRHRGAAESRAEILAYLDDDVLLNPSWWEGLQDAFRDPHVVLAGGPSLPEYEVSPSEWLVGMWEERDDGRRLGALSLIDQGREVRGCDPLDVWGLNYVIRKDALYQCGGFHPDCLPKSLQCFQGDGESGLSRKIHGAGARALYHPLMGVTHLISASRMTVEAFAEREFYQGVCSSYGRIRREGGVHVPSAVRWRAPLLWLKRTGRFSLGNRNSGCATIQQRLAKAYDRGGAWHKEQVRKRPELLRWVLKPEYFDYELPSVSNTIHSSIK